MATRFFTLGKFISTRPSKFTRFLLKFVREQKAVDITVETETVIRFKKLFNTVYILGIKNSNRTQQVGGMSVDLIFYDEIVNACDSLDRIKRVHEDVAETTAVPKFTIDKNNGDGNLV